MTAVPHAPRPPSALRRFLSSEVAGGLALMAAAVAAMLVANSDAGGWYDSLLEHRTGPVLAPALGQMTVRLWINDGLMALFFLLVGLEIKRELTDGRLTDPAGRRLPVIAAGCGMAVPALVYLAATGGNPALLRGWAIPAATDIAFAIGVMALLGSRVPAPLKLFLTTVAIVDDMGAVAIIAVAYSHGLDWGALAAAAGVLALMAGAARRGLAHPAWYAAGFTILWVLVLRSGVHATVSGVAAAATVPLVRSPGRPDDPGSTLHRMEHALSPWVSWVVVPIFGFANAGVSLGGGAEVLAAPLVVAVALGLFLGKQAGIMAGIALAVRFRLAPRPEGADWWQLYGAALLGGIGFTMSLFVGGLAFPRSPDLVDEVRIGVLGGSVLSAVAGYAVLRFTPRRRPA